MPFIDKNRYKIFNFGKIYKIDDECIETVQKLEDLREYIWSYRPPIILPIIIFSVIFAGIISIFIGFEYMDMLVFWSMLSIYSLISLIYYLKLKKAINCTKNK